MSVAPKDYQKDAVKNALGNFSLATGSRSPNQIR
jgi:hypothetical protein